VMTVGMDKGGGKQGQARARGTDVRQSEEN